MKLEELKKANFIIKYGLCWVNPANTKDGKTKRVYRIIIFFPNGNSYIIDSKTKKAMEKKMNIIKPALKEELPLHYRIPNFNQEFLENNVLNEYDLEDFKK